MSSIPLPDQALVIGVMPGGAQHHPQIPGAMLPAWSRRARAR
jgi:hypothetical protein